MTNQELPTSSSSSSELSSTYGSEESEIDSSDEEKTAIRRHYYGYRPRGIPSCIEEQREDVSTLDSKEELKQEKGAFTLKEIYDENETDSTQEIDDEVDIDKEVLTSNKTIEQDRFFSLSVTNVPDTIQAEEQPPPKDSGPLKECSFVQGIIVEKSRNYSEEKDECNLTPGSTDTIYSYTL